MNNLTRKIAAVAMAFTVLGTGAAVTNTIAPKSNNTITAYAIGGDQNYQYYTKPKCDRGWNYGRYVGVSSGTGVYWIQAMLNKWYRNSKDFEALVVDGKYGQKTEEAVKRFQRHNGLTADGIFGPNTYAKAKSLGYTRGYEPTY